MKTYAELRTFITTLLERDDLAVLLPQFIAMFESDLQSELFESDELIVSGSLVTSSNEAVVSLPGLHAVKSISYQGDQLQYRQGLVPDVVTGRPIAFSVEGATSLRLYPTPDQAYTLDVLYVPILSPLLMGGTIDDTAENWILTKWPNVYAYGVLATIYTYLSDDAKTAKFTQLYTTAVFKMQRVLKGGSPVAVNDLPI